MKVGLALLALWLPFAAAAADLFAQPVGQERLAAELAGLLQDLERSPALSGAFTQQRQLAGIARPLTSTGTFLFVRGRGIRWHTLTPFESEFMLTQKEIVVREGGTVALRVQSAEQPGLRLVSDVFLALFSLDFKSLAAHFDLYLLAGQPWRVGLVPRDATFKKAAARIELSGARRVDRVAFDDAYGDRTEIRFADVQALGAVPPAELERFGP